MQRRRFTIEFKQQVIQEAREVGNAAQVARRHNINPKILYRWMDQAERFAIRVHTALNSSSTCVL